MTGYVTRFDGTIFQLPTPLEWKFSYATGVPCDSFQMTCVWDGTDDSPILWREFTAVEAGETVFRGVVDEVETSLDEDGLLLTLSGRSMAALLLDNEAVGEDYVLVTLSDILEKYVTCFGVEVGECATFAPVFYFSVTTGSSAWAVMYEFCCYYGGVFPRFGVDGKLILTPWEGTETVVIDDNTPVSTLRCRDQRYGVVSEVLIRNKESQYVMTMENTSFLEMGGRCRRVMNLPSDGSYQSARYTAQYQMDVSDGNLFRLEVEIPAPFAAWPGQLVTLQRSNWSRNGTYRVMEAEVSMGSGGYVTKLELADPDIVL